MNTPVRLHDFHPEPESLFDQVVDGLGKTNKELPCKLFYDKRGSELFNRICELPEYYPTRTEILIMKSHADDMAQAVGNKGLVIEYGSGSSDKTRVLLDHLQDPVGYVPIEISRAQLLESARRIAIKYPRLEVLPVCADYEQEYEIPVPARPEKSRIAYFPGSTIGNFRPAEARSFLERIHRVCGPGGWLLIGVDLKKDARILNRAYNDDAGVTAEFNRNILARINRELGAEFDTNLFDHHAYYNESEGRVEMHLVSRTQQRIRIQGEKFEFAAGETIWTESSYKYSVPEFARLAAKSGFSQKEVWTDETRLFSVQLFRSDG
jgi:dimethylhistidine N-methyltransferase